MTDSPFAYESEDLRTLQALAALQECEAFIYCHHGGPRLVAIAGYIPAEHSPLLQCWSREAMPFTDRRGLYILELAHERAHWLSFYNARGTAHTTKWMWARIEWQEWWIKSFGKSASEKALVAIQRGNR